MPSAGKNRDFDDHIPRSMLLSKYRRKQSNIINKWYAHSLTQAGSARTATHSNNDAFQNCKHFPTLILSILSSNVWVQLNNNNGAAIIVYPFGKYQGKTNVSDTILTITASVTRSSPFCWGLGCARSAT